MSRVHGSRTQITIAADDLSAYTNASDIDGASDAGGGHRDREAHGDL